ncbi:MAG: hypothetical protein KC425_12550 [Anaerolineales bacterium]|nr:hypothetical protein [Anaerolineales bacterium]
MKFRTPFILALLAALLAFVLAACGSDPATLADIPAYDGATAVQPGEDAVADTLVQNMEQDASLRGSLGVGGSIEQMAYRLPADTTWEQVKGFYNGALGDAGWESGTGGPGGDLASSIMESASASNPLFQTSLWSRDDQTLTLVRTVNPTNEAEVYLILSLNTN